MSIGARGRTIQHGSFYVLLAMLPFSKAAIEIMFGVLLLGWVMERLDPATRAETVWARPSFRPLALAIGGFLAVCAASIAVSDFPMTSARGFVGKWLEYLMLFVMMADVGSRPGVARRGLVILACSAFAVVLQAVGQEWFVVPGPFQYHPALHYRRMTGPYENPIDLATYMMVVIPVLASYARVQATRGRWLLGILVMALIGCLARTEALGAWLALCIGVVVIISVDRTMRRIGIGLLVAVVVLAGAVLSRGGHLSDVTSWSDIGKVDRLVMWQAAVGMIRDRPILGHGVNTFMANYLDYWVGGERQPRYAHNCYLQVAAETGLVGLLAFTALLWLLFARLVAGLRRIRDDDRMILLGCLGGLLAFAVQAGIDTNFYSLRQAALFWTLAGFAIGIGERTGETVSGSV